MFRAFKCIHASHPLVCRNVLYKSKTKSCSRLWENLCSGSLLQEFWRLVLGTSSSRTLISCSIWVSLVRKVKWAGLMWKAGKPVARNSLYKRYKIVYNACKSYTVESWKAVAWMRPRTVGSLSQKRAIPPPQRDKQCVQVKSIVGAAVGGASNYFLGVLHSIFPQSMK